MRIMIANNQPKVRFALRVALEQRPGFKTINEAIDSEDLIVQSRVICPDLVMLDWELPGLPMSELISTLHQCCGNTHVVILSSRSEMREQALAAGANAFVCMCDAPDELLSAIDDCLKDEQAQVKDKQGC